MKKLFAGVGVFLLGFILVFLLGLLFGKNGNAERVICIAIVYLAAVIYTSKAN